MNETDEYRLRWRGRESGPFPLAEINRQLDDHEIGMSHEIFCHDEWISLEEFFAATTPPPPELRPKTTAIRVDTPAAPLFRMLPEGAPGPPQRRRLLFAFLAIVAGYAGAHNFYARQWLTGLLQLLLSVATCLMGFGIIASWIWAMVEAVMVRKDGNGIDMI